MHPSVFIQQLNIALYTKLSIDFRKRYICLLNKQCFIKHIVYRAEFVLEGLPTMHHIGQTEGTFKTRYISHATAFRLCWFRNSIPLCRYI